MISATRVFKNTQNRTGAGRKLRATFALILLGALAFVPKAPAPTPSSNPFPIRNGVLETDLNANNFKINNLDTSNLGLGSGPGSGIDTGTTTAILKGNGAHGIADAVAGTDYLSPTGSGLLLTGVVLTANNLSDLVNAATARTNLVLGNVDNTTDLNKPISTATQTALDLKAATSDMTTALALKADAADLTTGLAAKEDTLPTTGNDGYILARDIDGNWHFVDPVTLGTTSQTFTDGVENTTTTFTSASAAFVAGDVGKTITGDNIPASTTIASRTNGTTIVLSQAATATASGNTFTIINRLEVGGTGTVTSVTQTSTIGSLVTIGLTNTTTSPAFTFDFPATVPALTFYGNPNSFIGPASFMTFTQARTALGLGTMALQANTGVSTAIQKGNGTGGLSPTVAGTDYLTPTGSGTGLTGVLKSANNLSDVTAATARTNLGLSTVAATGAFFDLVAPTVGTFTFYGNPAGTTGPASFMTAASARTALALDTAAKDVVQVGSDATNTITNGVTTFVEGAPLTVSRTRTLPLASSYVDGATLRYLDTVTTALMGPRFLPAAGNTLKGIDAATWALGYSPFTAGGFENGSKSVTFQKRGTDWKVYSLGGESLTIRSIQNAGNLQFAATFNANNLTADHFITLFDGEMAVPAVTDPLSLGALTDINSDGSVTKRRLTQVDLLPSIYPVGATGDSVTGSFSVTNTNPGSIDTIAVLGSLAGPITVVLPDAGNYDPGTPISLIDFSSSVGSINNITITAHGTDNINNTATTLVFDEKNGKRLITSDGAGSWSIPSGKAISTSAYTVLTAASGTFTLTPDATIAGAHKAHMVLGNGVNNLVVPNPFDGMTLDLILVQPSSGAAGTINLPIGSAVFNGGAGLVTLTATNSAVDRLQGAYDGTLGEFVWQPTATNATSAALPSAPSSLSISSVTASTENLAWTDNASNETGFDVQRSLDNVTFAHLATTAANATTYGDTGLTPATAYYYKVRAQNTGGFSSFSNTATDTTSASCSVIGNSFGTGGTSGTVFADASNKVYLADSFVVASGAGSICRIEAALFYTVTPKAGQVITLEIRNNSAGTPGTVVSGGTSTNSVAASALPTSNGGALASPQSFTFSGVSLTVGGTYWIAVHASSFDTTGSSHPSWSVQATGTQTFYKSADGNNWSTQGSNVRHYVKTYH